MAGWPPDNCAARQNYLVFCAGHGRVCGRRLADEPGRWPGAAGAAAGCGVLVHVWAGHVWRNRYLCQRAAAAAAAVSGGVGGGVALSAVGKRARGRLSSLPDWLLLLPGFYLPGGLPLAVATLVVLYAHAGSVLARAHQDEDPEQLTVGAVLFVAATMVAYF